MANIRITDAINVPVLIGTEFLPVAYVGSSSAFNLSVAAIAAYGAARNARLTNSVYIMDPIFGAYADGVTDDTLAFAAATAAISSNGGELILPSNTTFLLNSMWTINKPNVTVRGMGFSTVLKRSSSLTNPLVNFTGTSGVFRDLTVDGNLVNTTAANAEVQMAGAGGLAERIRVINANSLSVVLQAANTRLTSSTIVGRSGSALQSYGVWAINHQPGIMIDHNTISNAGIEGIGADGLGLIIEGNRIFNCHSYTGIGGGQIVIYDGGGNSCIGATINGNTIDTGNAAAASGMELNGSNMTITGNTVNNQNYNGIVLQAGTGFLISGNLIRNSGFLATAPAVRIATGVSGWQVVGNRLIDDQGTATQSYGVQVIAGSSNNYQIEGNTFSGNAVSAIGDSGTGLNKTISRNLGIDNVIPSVASAAALPFPINPIFAMTGTTGVTSITGPAWTGRTVTILPAGAVTFTAGATIVNTVTTTANVPLRCVYNGTAWALG